MAELGKHWRRSFQHALSEGIHETDDYVQHRFLFLRYGDLSKLSDRIYLGGYADLLDPEALKGLGITAIANLSEIDFGLDEDGFKSFCLDQEDSTDIPDEKIVAFLRQMDEWWEAGEVILIHCRAGISRTASFVIVWLMHRKGCHGGVDLEAEWQRALDKIGAVRDFVRPHSRLKRSILAYFEGRQPPG